MERSYRRGNEIVAALAIIPASPKIQKDEQKEDKLMV